MAISKDVIIVGGEDRDSYEQECDDPGEDVQDGDTYRYGDMNERIPG